MDSSLAPPFLLLLLLRSASGNSEMLESKIISPKDGDFTNVTLENCTDHEVWDDNVFSVPGEAFMINCTPDDLPFDFQDVPYNVSWYGPRTQGQLGRDTGRTLARGTALWLFNAELEDTGAYVCVVRTASQCFKQTRYVKVNQPSPECAHPYTFHQILDKGGNGKLFCPLRDIITNEDIQGYNVQWYKGCELIVGDPEGKFSYLDENWRLKVTAVKPEDKGFYTCAISFVLAEVPSNISATISLHVNEKTIPRPQLIEPANETVKATLGSSFSKACRVSLLGEGNPSVDLEWISSKQDKFFESDDTQRVYTDDQQTLRREDGVRQMEMWLKFSTVEEEDFYVNYSCYVYSSRGFAEAHFTLMPAENCTDHEVWDDDVFSVPGEAFMINCTPDDLPFDFQDVPYNVSWYGPRTQGQLGRDTGRTLARGTALWLFNAELEDTGAYVCVVRTASQCFKQTRYVKVNQTSPEFKQILDKGGNGQLHCPLRDLITNEDIQGYNVQWYKGCELIVGDPEGKFSYLDENWRLKVTAVKPEDKGLYTCSISFVLAGVPSNISATISLHVNEKTIPRPQLIEPANETVKATLGSSFSKACRVSLLGEGNPSVDLEWISSKQDKFFESNDTQRVYTDDQQLRQEDGVLLLEKWLKFSTVEEEDFYGNYSCRVYSFRGFAEAYFILLPDDCTDHRVPTGVISVSCTLVAPAWFDFQDVPYNISWYGPRTQGQLGRDTGRTLARGTALWLSNAELEDTGAYVCVVRTASQCFKQTTYLIVNQPSPDCAHPYTFNHTLNNTVYGQLVISKDNSIQWHKGCEPIEDGEGKFTYMGGRWRLKVAKLKPKNWRFYTCAKSLVLAGVPSNNSATISCHVNEENALLQGLLEPANEIVEVMLGSSFSKACRVSVLGEGNPSVDLKWIFSRRGEYLTNDSTQRVYSESQVLRQEDGVMQLERWLKFSTVEEEDFYANYSCHVNSSIGFAEAHFTLLPADPNLLLPVRLLLTSLWVLVIAAVIIYYHFKIHIVLLIRSTLPCLYKTTDSDGKLYDAYVAYPRLFGGGASGEAEKFALHTLPQVLEGRCGYKLFIFGRDSPLGDAAVDVVEESMQASRRLLLLYSASTFGGGGEEAGRERYEREAAMYRALQEGSLRVVLVELEEVGPAQLALFPQSLRHLRQRQGAVRLWTGTRTRGRPADEAELSPGPASLSPSPRFWRELRYHMPVRAKRATS